MSEPARWKVFWTDPGCRAVDCASDPVLAGLSGVAELMRSDRPRAADPFLLRSDGRYPAEVNEFLGSPRLRGCAEGTRRKYATGLALWLGFLDAVGCCWADATAEQVDAWKFWRMSDEANPRRVAGGTVKSGLVAISAFYAWAEPRYGVPNPVQRNTIRLGTGRPVEGLRAAPRVVRDRNVKWLDPAGYRRWRDTGLRGFSVDSVELERWRGRCAQRDCAFVDGLYGTGGFDREPRHRLCTNLDTTCPGVMFVFTNSDTTSGVSVARCACSTAEVIRALPPDLGHGG